MAWLLIAVTVSVFLHPVLLGNVITFVLGNILSSWGLSFSVKRVSVLSLTFTGLCLSTKKRASNDPSTLTIEDICLSIQFRKAIASWFEERPFKLKIVKLRVHDLKSEETCGKETTSKSSPGSTYDADKGILSPLLGNESILKKMIAASRLLALEVNGVEVVSETVDSSTVVSLESLHLSALYFPHKHSEDVKGGSFTVLFKTQALKASIKSPGYDSPSFSLSSLEVECEMDVAQQAFTELNVRFGVISVSCGVLAIKKLKHEKNDDTLKEGIEESEEISTDKGKKLILADIPKKVLIKVEMFTCQVLDDRNEDYNGFKMGFTDLELATSSTLTNVSCSSAISLGIGESFADLVHRSQGVRMLHALQALVASEFTLDNNVTTNDITMQCNRVNVNYKKVSLLMSGAAASTLTNLQSALKVSTTPSSNPAAPTAPLPAFWPKSVIVGVETARFELRDLHESDASPGVGAVFVQHSSFMGLASCVEVNLDSTDSPSHYNIKANIPSMVARALLLSQHKPSDGADMDSLATGAKKVKLAAVSSGASVRAACHVDVRLSVQSMTARAVMDGKMRERMDEVSCGEVVVSEGHAEVARFPHMKVTSTSPQLLDIRLSPLVEIGSGARFQWSAALGYRALRIALVADSSLLRALRACFPPNPNKSKPHPQPMMFKLCGQSDVVLHGNRKYQLSVSMRDAELSLTPMVSEDHTLSSMLMSSSELNIHVQVDGVLICPSLMSCTGMQVSRSLEVKEEGAMEDWLINFNLLSLQLPGQVQVGDLIDIFLSQDAAISAMSAAVKQGISCCTTSPLDSVPVSTASYFTSDGTPIHTAQVQQKQAVIRSMAVTLQTFNVQVFDEKSQLFSFCSKNICLSSDVLRDPKELVEELRCLDHHVGDVAYSNVMGSKINVEANELCFMVHSEEESFEFLNINEAQITFSPVIMASLAPIPSRSVAHTVTLHHITEGDAVVIKDCNVNPSWFSLPPSDDEWDVVVVKDMMPSKLYMNLKTHLTLLRANVSAQVQPTLLAMSDELKRMTPQPVIDDTFVNQPLPWWDNIRYQLHGACKTSVSDLTVSIELDTPTKPPVSSPMQSRGRRTGSMPPPVLDLPPTLYVHFNTLMLASSPCKREAFSECRDRPIEADLCTLEQCKEWRVGELEDLRALSFEGMTLSVPATPPHRWYDSTNTRDLHHVMFLLPRCNATLMFNWNTYGQYPFNHHIQLPSPAIRRTSSVSSVKSSSSHDAYHLFRSRGVQVTVDLNMLGPSSLDVTSTSMELESEVGCWAALPLELFGWLMDQTEGEKEEKEVDAGSPISQLLGVTLNLRHSSAFISAWPSSTDLAGLTLELKHYKLVQQKSRQSCLTPLNCDLLEHDLAAVRVHLSKVTDVQSFQLPWNADGNTRGTQLLGALVSQRHVVRAASGGRQLALQAAGICVKRTPLDTEEEDVEASEATMAKTSASRATSETEHVDGYATFLSVFDFRKNHSLLKPSEALPEGSRRRSSNGRTMRRSSVSSVGSRRSSSGIGRRGSMTQTRESFDTFASSLLSPCSPGSPAFRKSLSSTFSDTPRDGSSPVGMTDSIFDDEDDVKSKFDEDTDKEISGSDSGSDSFGLVSDDESYCEDDEDDDDEDERLMRTELEVRDMRFVYTIPIRDRFTHMSKTWVKLFGDKDTTQVFDDAEEGEVLVANQDSQKSHGDRLTNLFLRRHSENLDDNIAAVRRQSSNNSEADGSWKEGGTERVRATANAVAAAAATFESTIRYRVKFINPQVNILCAKTKGALVLGVAEASLVGRDLGVFYAQRLTDGGRNVLVKHERLVAIAGALAFSASMDVDVNRGICWIKNVANPTQDVLLRQVMTPFDMRIRAEEFTAVSLREWGRACASMTAAVRRLNKLALDTTYEPPLCELRSLSDRLRVDLPELHLSLDRDDFAALSDIVSHVLLAPPFESSTSEGQGKPQEEYHVVGGCHVGQWNCDSKESRYALKALVEEELSLLSQERALHPPARMRVVEFNLGKGTWFLKPSQGDSREVQIGFSGFTASHQFFSDETIESVLTLENMWVFNDKPGALSLRLPDPMVILKPQRQTEPLCRYCFKFYIPEENSRSSCGCHANTWGEDGYFISRGGRSGEWTCCGDPSPRAPHCSTKQHASGFHMINVRATTTKPMLVGETPVHVFSELQISLFPSTKQTMELQLTSDIANFINSYFFEEEAVSASTRGGGGGEDISKSLFGSRVSGTREINRDSSDEEEDIKPVTRRGGENPTPVVYLKYCRISEITLELSTVGFGTKWGVNLDREKICLNSPAFHRSQRIVTWAQLGVKYSKHVATNLVRGSRKKAAPVTSLSTSTGSMSGEEEEEERSKTGRLTSMGSVSAVHKGVLGAASSMMKAKAVATSVLKKSTSSNKTNSQKEARDMLFGNKTKR